MQGTNVFSGGGVRRPNTFTKGAPTNYIAGLGRGAIGFTTRSDIGPARTRNSDADGEGASSQGGASSQVDQHRLRLAQRRSEEHGMVNAFGGGGANANAFKHPPVGYVAGAGRGSGGFGEKKPSLHGEKEDGRDYSEGNYDPETGYGGSLFSGENYDKDDKAADDVWDAINERMDGRRKRQREEKLKVQLEKFRVVRPKISDQFADLKAELSTVSEADWAAIPDTADYSIRHKKRETFTPMSDVNIDSLRTATLGATVNSLSQRQMETGGEATPWQTGGAQTDLAGMSAARDQMLRVILDRKADSVTGQTVVDPKGYLTDLNSLKVTSSAEIGDIKKARMLLTSVTTTNPKHGPGWIAAARLEEVAGKMVQARQIIKQGCLACPESEDVWIEAARLQTPANAKVVLANAVRHLPNSVKIWIAAADLEGGSNDEELAKQRRRQVLRRALEFVPNSVKLWMLAVELEEADDARVMLARAVECVPHAVELWLALARLESYANAQVVLNKAREAVPSEPKIWIAASMLQEANENAEACEKIMDRAVKSLGSSHVVIDRETWLKEAEAAEEAGAPLTCGAIVRATIAIGVEDADRKRTWLDDADSAETRGRVATARAIYAYMLTVFPSKKSIWLQAAALEKKHGTRASLQGLLRKAVASCPQAEILWLMAAKETWLAGDVGGARNVLMQAFAANHDSEQIWLAAVKLEWENDEFVRARALLAKARARSSTRRVWLKSALLEREVGDNAAEAKLLDDALVAYPSFDKLWMMAAQAAEARGDVAKAREFFHRGLERCPRSVVLWVLTANIEERTSGVVKARSVLELARLKNPKTPRLWLEAVRLEARHDHASGSSGGVAGSKLAATLLAKGLQECPKSGELWAEHIASAPKAQQRARSVDALKKCDNDPFVVLAVASLFQRDRKLPKARKWYNRAVTLNPDLGDAWAAYYKFELAHGSPEQAEAIMERCVQAEPRHGDAWCAVSKVTANRKLKHAELLPLAAARLAVQSGGGRKMV